MSERVVLKGRKVVGGTAEGEALVTKQIISTWGGVDAVKGIITERRHELRNQSFAGKIFVFPSAKGSSGWSTVAQVIRLAGKALKAIIIREVNSLTAIGPRFDRGSGYQRQSQDCPGRPEGLARSAECYQGQ